MIYVFFITIGDYSCMPNSTVIKASILAPSSSSGEEDHCILEITATRYHELLVVSISDCLLRPGR